MVYKRETHRVWSMRFLISLFPLLFQISIEGGALWQRDVGVPLWNNPKPFILFKGFLYCFKSYDMFDLLNQLFFFRLVLLWIWSSLLCLLVRVLCLFVGLILLGIGFYVVSLGLFLCVLLVVLFSIVGYSLLFFWCIVWLFGWGFVGVFGLCFVLSICCYFVVGLWIGWSSWLLRIGCGGCVRLLVLLFGFFVVGFLLLLF